uniref:Dol-P-Glc:Glc(2)Man(9)GlcNAc(2)-PP-Dol alpha-1,2-glucosyltransferase n=1 Tax=Aceria tosichella TaxID=561515 RepID=A0A6G1SMM9_9ACAR
MPVRKASFGLSVAALSSIIYLALHYISNSINNAVKEPYMDEIFHVPQAQRYCQGNFTYYDPKITTPPGLYLFTYARIWLRDIVLIRRSNLICDTIDLRRTNHSIAILNFVTLVLIQLTAGDRVNLSRRYGFKQRAFHTLNNSTTYDLVRIILNSLVILLLPPLFFFNSLYYTDAGSVLFTLLVYLFSLIDQHLLAALCGIVSILFRQTNVVWVFYVACLTILRTFEEHHKRQNLRKSQQHQQQAKTNSRSHHGGDQSNLVTSESAPGSYCYLPDKQLLFALIKRCTPYAMVGVSFIGFVFINKGIVLGDKEAHQPRLHSAQVLYFLGFCSMFGTTWVLHLRILKRFLYFTIRTPLVAVLVSALVIYLISFGRYAHPYLLADNRHITFYIWRRILDRHNSYVPFMLTPIYLVSSFSVWHHLRSKGCKQMLLFLFCTILVTVPNGLLELRYFIIPYIFLRLNADTSLESSLCELLQQIFIITSMHYLFIYKTFHWTDSSELQRIMW